MEEEFIRITFEDEPQRNVWCFFKTASGMVFPGFYNDQGEIQHKNRMRIASRYAVLFFKYDLDENGHWKYVQPSEMEPGEC